MDCQMFAPMGSTTVEVGFLFFSACVDILDISCSRHTSEAPTMGIWKRENSHSQRGRFEGGAWGPSSVAGAV